MTLTRLPDIYFLPEWGRYYEEKEQKGETKIFELKNEWGHVFYQFIVRPIPINADDTTYYDTITPYGFSGPIILHCSKGKKEELAAKFNEEFQKYCEENKIVTEYIRFNPWVQNLEDFKDFYSTRDHGSTLVIDLTVPDFFMDEFSSNARRQVRRAKKNDVEIEFDYTGFSIKEFHRLYNLMAKKNDIDEYYMFTEEFLHRSFKALEGRQFIVSAKHEGKYVSAALVLHYGDYIHYHLAANDPDYYHLAGNSLIMYEACRWGVENGKAAMHLGGAGSDENLFRFKKAFTRTDTLDLLVGKKIRNKEIYDMLVNYKKSHGGIENENYFPLYRG